MKAEDCIYAQQIPGVGSFRETGQLSRIATKSQQLAKEVWHEILYSNLVPGQEVPKCI